jgi:hypothetical protein
MSALATAFCSASGKTFILQNEQSQANCIAVTTGIDAIFSPSSIIVDTQVKPS